MLHSHYNQNCDIDKIGIFADSIPRRNFPIFKEKNKIYSFKENKHETIPDFKNTITFIFKVYTGKEARSPLNQTIKIIPKFGCAKGTFKMADDFDAPLDDFAEYIL